jgi:hypothetical protein
MRLFTKQSSFFFCVKLVQGVCSPHQLPLWKGGSDPKGFHVCKLFPSLHVPSQQTQQVYPVPRTTYLVSCASYLAPRTSYHAPRIWHITKILEQKIQYLNLEDEIKCLFQIFLVFMGSKRNTSFRIPKETFNGDCVQGIIMSLCTPFLEEALTGQY